MTHSYQYFGCHPWRIFTGSVQFDSFVEGGGVGLGLLAIKDQPWFGALYTCIVPLVHALGPQNLVSVSFSRQESRANTLG
jgi:hypothetical protein